MIIFSLTIPYIYWWLSHRVVISLHFQLLVQQDNYKICAPDLHSEGTIYLLCRCVKYFHHVQCHSGNHYAWCHESEGLQCILIHLPFKKWQFLSCYNFVGKFIPVLNSLLSAFVHVCWAASVAQTVDCLQFSSVQLLSCVWRFATPWITARQASLFIINSQSSLRLPSIESVMPSSHLTVTS